MYDDDDDDSNEIKYEQNEQGTTLLCSAHVTQNVCTQAKKGRKKESQPQLDDYCL